MSGSSARMLRLLSLLQTHRYWQGTELADRLEVSSRTVRRDVDRLRELGYPVDASRGSAGGYQLQAGASLPPLLLEDDEAVAIAVGLRAAAGGVVSGVEDASVRALAKIVQVMPKRLRRRVDALQEYTVPAPLAGPTIDAVALSTLAQACRDSERLRFAYTRYDGAAADRLVEPHRLVSLGRRWYLVAWDLERHDWRSFRVDRLTEPALQGVPFRPRELPAADAAEFVKAGIASRPTKYDVRILVHAPADLVQRTVSRWGEVEPIDDASCRLSMSVDQLDWPAMVVASVGADFEIESPDELRGYVRDVAERFGRAAR
ncbi:helix-turn-helix transcriptional regulator [Solicola gregarius]|uniref:YafY family transcriptional regulator n=1 Tax=Solicola gregarius TaxID=2908642 RepID=A0AA46THQ7_9ACTN|nr:YafY family protein [Solicola gregarius]UYM04733.1 YafY family transcriptional regulator [Solicola gregarius]